MTLSGTPEKLRFGRFSGNPYATSRLYTPSASEMLRSPQPKQLERTPPTRCRSRTGTPTPVKTPRNTSSSDYHVEHDLSQREVDFIDHQAKLKKAHDEVIQLTTEMKQKKNDLAHEQESLARLDEALALRRIKSNVEETEITDKEKRIREKEAILEKVKVSVQERAHNIEALEKEINERLVAIEESQKVLDSKETALRQRTVNVQKREAEIEECEAWVESREMETRGIHQIGDVDVGDLKRNIQSLEKGIADKDRIIEQLESALAANSKITIRLNKELHSRTLPKAEDSLQDKEEKLRQLYESLCAIELRISVKGDELSSKSVAVEESAKNLINEIHSKQEELNSVMGAKQKAIDEKVSENKLLVISLAKKVKEDDSKSLMERQVLEAEIETLKNIIDDFKRESHAKQRSQQETITELERTLEGTRSFYRDVESQLKDTQAQLSHLKGQAATPRNESESVEIELKRKKMEVDMNNKLAEVERKWNEVKHEEMKQKMEEERIAKKKSEIKMKEQQISESINIVREEEQKLLAFKEELEEREGQLTAREVLLTARPTLHDSNHMRSKSACTEETESSTESDSDSDSDGADFISPAACSNTSSGRSPAFAPMSPSGASSTPMSGVPTFSPMVLHNERVQVRRMSDGTELLGCTSDPKLMKKIAKMKKKEEEREHKLRKELKKQARKDEKKKEKEDKKRNKTATRA